jgi:hypothetical protein
MKTVLGNSEAHVLYENSCQCLRCQNAPGVPGLVFGKGKFQASIRWPKEGKPGPRQIVIKELVYAQGVGPIKEDNQAVRTVLILDFHNIASAKVFRNWVDLIIAGHPGSFPDSQTSPGNYEQQVDTAPAVGELNDDVHAQGRVSDSVEIESESSGREAQEIGAKPEEIKDSRQHEV